MRVELALVFPLFSCLSLVAGQERCPRGWVRGPDPNRVISFGSTCHKAFTDQLVDWGRAKALCIEEGAKLLEVNSPAEREAVWGLKKIGRGHSLHWAQSLHDISCLVGLNP